MIRNSLLSLGKDGLLIHYKWDPVQHTFVQTSYLKTDAARICYFAGNFGLLGFRDGTFRYPLFWLTSFSLLSVQNEVMVISSLVEQSHVLTADVLAIDATGEQLLLAIAGRDQTIRLLELQLGKNTNVKQVQVIKTPESPVIFLKFYGLQADTAEQITGLVSVTKDRNVSFYNLNGNVKYFDFSEVS